MNRWANLLQQLQNWVRLSVVNAEYFIGHNVMEEVLRVRYLSQPEASDAVYATLHAAESKRIVRFNGAGTEEEAGAG